MNNNTPPDFHKLANDEYSYMPDGDEKYSCITEYVKCCNEIWNDYALPEKQKTDELLEALKNLALATPNYSTWDYPSAWTKANELITKYEAINKQ